jgi:hypothetical protein
MITTTHNQPQQKYHLWLTIAGLTGIVSLFLPFTYDISPLMALQDGFFNFWRIAIPAFLSVFVFIAAMRWILAGSFNRILKTIAYVLSAASAYLTVSFFFMGGASPSGFVEWIAFAIVIVVLISGSWLLISKLKKQVTAVYSPIIALEVAYLANCLMCLFIFAIEYGWQIGAWFILATAVIYLLQIYLFATQRDKTPDQGHEAERRN